MDNSQVSKRELLGQGLMSLFVGTSLLVAGLLAARQLHVVWNVWPTTDGVVVRNAVQEVAVPSGKEGIPAHAFSPQVEFQYTIEGRSFTAEAPATYTFSTYQKTAEILARSYMPGAHYPIRYNPRDPAEIRYAAIEFAPLAIAFVLLFAGIALASMGFRPLMSAYGMRAGSAAASTAAAPVAARPPAVIICPSCGRQVPAADQTCPNCLKSLRAA